MKRNIKLLLIFLICMCLVSFSCYVRAEDEEDEDICKITLTADKTTVKPGDEVTVTIKMSNITNESGVTRFISELTTPSGIEPVAIEDTDDSLKDIAEDFDTDSTDKFQLLYGNTSSEVWCITYIEEADTIYAKNITDPQTEDGVIGKIKFKVSDSITISSGTISLDTVVITAEAEDEIESFDDVEEQSDTIQASQVKLNISGSGGTSGGSGASAKPSNTANNSVNTSKGNSNANANKTNATPKNTVNSDVPYAGIEDELPLFIILTTIAIISYIGYRKQKDI